MSRGGYFCVSARIGICGSLRFTVLDHGLGGREEYFDEAGGLVTVVTMTDVDYPPCGGSYRYGSPVCCERVVVEDFCSSS